MTTAISIQNVSKAYRLGVIGHGTLREDLQSWWAKVRGKEDPNRIIGSKEAIEGDTLWALRDVSFDVEQGSVWGIIGANGAGKSTLLKILSRVTAPTSGQIKVRGRVASLLEVGTGFHPELTGRENIFLNGAILGMTKAEVRKKFDEIVAFSEIEKFIDTPVKRYSSGMYVRLAFAVAAHLDPEILVVDEVLAVGDAAFQKKCLGKMGAVAKEGRTVLFVSHNMGAVRNLCQHGIVLRSGREAFQGTANDAVDFYLLKSGEANTTTWERSTPPPHPGTGANVFFQRAWMNMPEEGFSTDTPLEFRFCVKANHAVENCRINATIANLDETPIGSVSSIHFFPIREGEEKILRFAVKDHHLALGTYRISFSLGTGNFQTQQRDFEVLVNPFQFKVTKFSGCGATGGFAQWPKGWGAIAFSSDLEACGGGA
jgi:lipopolysaccharide transport system ATP-binding protein